MALKAKMQGASQVKAISTDLSIDVLAENEPICADLCFPMVYRNVEYYNLACQIYDDFVEKLNITAELTEEMVRAVVTKHISEYSLPKTQLKAEIADFVVDNLLYFGPVSTIMRISGADLNDILEQEM